MSGAPLPGAGRDNPRKRVSGLRVKEGVAERMVPEKGLGIGVNYKGVFAYNCNSIATVLFRFVLVCPRLGS